MIMNFVWKGCCFLVLGSVGIGLFFPYKYVGVPKTCFLQGSCAFFTRLKLGPHRKRLGL